MLLETNELLPVNSKLTEPDLVTLMIEEFPHCKEAQSAAKRGNLWRQRKYYRYGDFTFGLRPKRLSYEYDALGRAWLNRKLVRPQPEVWDGKQSMERLRAESVEVLRGETNSPEWKEQWTQYNERRAARDAVRRSKAQKESAGVSALRRSARAGKARRKASDLMASRKREVKRTYRASHVGRGVPPRTTFNPRTDGGNSKSNERSEQEQDQEQSQVS